MEGGIIDCALVSRLERSKVELYLPPHPLQVPQPFALQVQAGQHPVLNIVTREVTTQQHIAARFTSRRATPLAQIGEERRLPKLVSCKTKVW